MKLTGKAKEAFLYFYWETKIKPLKMTICKREDLESFFGTISGLIQNAFITEWFDFVGIYINISAIPFSKDFRVEIRSIDNSFLSSCDYESFNSRQEATNAAIEKANELYNSENK